MCGGHRALCDIVTRLIASEATPPAPKRTLISSYAPPQGHHHSPHLFERSILADTCCLAGFLLVIWHRFYQARTIELTSVLNVSLKVAAQMARDHARLSPDEKQLLYTWYIT